MRFGAYMRYRGDPAFVKSLLPGMKKNYEGWSASISRPRWECSGRAGMTMGWNTTSTAARRRTSSAGRRGNRPALNSYMWADAQAIARLPKAGWGSRNGGAIQRGGGEAKGERSEEPLGPAARFLLPHVQQDESAMETRWPRFR